MIIRNISEELKENIPELANVDYRSANGRTWLTLPQWKARLSSIERKNLKTFGKTVTAASMEKYFGECIYERDENSNVLINEAAYKLIRKFLTSTKFNVKEA